MSSKRKVTLKLTTQKDLIHIESDARTFGELQKEVPDVRFDGLRVVERSTKVTLQNPDAILPAGDFILFLVPEKVKSGMSKKKEGLKKLKNLDDANYNELRSHASYLNNMKNARISMNGATDDLRKAIKAYYDDKDKLKAYEPIPEQDAISMIEEARIKINAAIDLIIANSGTTEVPVEDNTEYLIKVSVDDLDAEIKSIKSALKL